MKFAVCAIAKLENHYIREWVEYYISLGFDKIILYDNNDLDGELLSAPISDYVASGIIDLIDARGKAGYQVQAYNECYQNYKDRVDWILFVDIDEFLAFEDTNIHTIQEFINSNEQFLNYNSILFNWRIYTDTNLVKVLNNDYNVLSRFTVLQNDLHEDIEVKEMIRTGIPNLQINSVHAVRQWSSPTETAVYIENSEEAIKSVKFCDALGEQAFPTHPSIVFKPAYIKHFKYKTLQEYLELKCNRGYPMPFRDYGTNLSIVDFFMVNSVTEEKLNYLDIWLNLPDVSPQEKLKVTEGLEELRNRGLIK